MENQNKKEFVITRVFNAPRGLVWKAWTDPEMAAKWWGPKDFTAPSIKIDLRVGGKYIFCMRGQAGPGQPVMDFWSTGTYKEIVPEEKLVSTDSFSNEKGEIIKPAEYGMDPNFPEENTVTATFEDEGEGTRLTISYAVESDAVLEAMNKVQMREGWESSLEKLADILK
jgi:uncharacterized protein YndB with AHSA1/START domain